MSDNPLLLKQNPRRGRALVTSSPFKVGSMLTERSVLWSIEKLLTLFFIQ